MRLCAGAVARRPRWTGATIRFARRPAVLGPRPRSELDVVGQFERRLSILCRRWLVQEMSTPGLPVRAVAAGVFRRACFLDRGSARQQSDLSGFLSSARAWLVGRHRPAITDRRPYRL